MNYKPFPLLFLFTSDLPLANQAELAGVDSVIVDWETIGKHDRQANYDTEINDQNPEDVAQLAQQLTIPITVRVNRLGSYSGSEINLALDHGAKIIMLPMAETAKEVETFVNLVGNRAKTLIQIENQSLVDQCAELNQIDLDYAYIGLNDLMISRGATCLWDVLLDKTIENIVNMLENRKVGFGAFTIIGGGMPIPFVHFLREMVRLECSLSVMRRTFKKEIVGRDFKSEIQAMKAVWNASCLRDPHAVEQDHLILLQQIEEAKKIFYS